MKRFFRVLLAVGLLGAVLVTAPSGTAFATDKTMYYVSLGDSIAGGGRFYPNDDLYPDKLTALLQDRYPKLEAIKLGCPGASTASMLQANSYPPKFRDCPEAWYLPPPHGSLVDIATSFMEAHKGSIALVTITIGANDIPPGCDFYDLTCLHAAEDSISANLPGILAALRDAAGPDVPIIGMTYYTQGLALWFDDPSAAEFAVNAGLPFNDVLESVYESAGALVADVEGAFETTNFTIDEETGVPVNVEHICDWTNTCDSGDPHPNDTGHEVIAEAFEAALPA
jgi:hypothetical protein